MEDDYLVKLDVKDKKILSLLELNSRTPASIIGKRVGLSKARVLSRIFRLSQSGLIDRFGLELNYAAVGVVNYRFYFKFENTPKNFEQRLAEYLYTHGAVRWFCLVQGEWDLILRFFAADDSAIEKFEADFMEEFGDYVSEKVYGVNLFGSNHRCTFLTGNEGSYYRQTREYKGGKLPLTTLDYRILFWLYENSRMPLREIAKKEGISPNVVAYHVRKLEKMKAFFAYSLRFNRTRAGYMSTKVLIKMRKLTPARREQFLAYCDALPMLSHYLILLGAWDAEMDVDAKNSRELYVLLRSIRNKFPDLIRGFSVLTKIKEYESNPFASLAGKKIPKHDVPDFTV
ncbi:HTH-type transcriptional regulator LysM [uncultured archaeon]|nr:HTH-type transcriptional regulator LysM [uncultured archaeon]